MQPHGEKRDEKSKGVNLARLAGAMKLDKSAVSRRARAAADAGYVVNLEDRRGKPARYVIGEPLPEEKPILPAPTELQRRPRPGGALPTKGEPK